MARQQAAVGWKQLTQSLVPFECMLAERPFLLRAEPHFIDFDLWGMLAVLPLFGPLPNAGRSQLFEWNGTRACPI